MLPAELRKRAGRHAYRKGISFGEFVRRAIESATEAAPEAKSDPLLASHAVLRGRLAAYISTRHDAYLYGED